jgi:hypothetical protein
VGFRLLSAGLRHYISPQRYLRASQRQWRIGGDAVGSRRCRPSTTRPPLFPGRPPRRVRRIRPYAAVSKSVYSHLCLDQHRRPVHDLRIYPFPSGTSMMHNDARAEAMKDTASFSYILTCTQLLSNAYTNPVFARRISVQDLPSACSSPIQTSLSSESGCDVWARN